MHEVETLLTGYGLVEGPVWDGDGLLFTDVPNGGLHRLDTDGSVSTVLPHRRGMGGVALHAAGGYVVSGRNVAYKTPGTTTVLLEPGDGHTGRSYNDLGTDSAGRVYVGSLEFDPLTPGADGPHGELYRIELDGSVTTLADDVALSNGLAVSPDERSLYHSDSRRGLVWRYALDASGEVTGRSVLAEFAGGTPDGLAVAADSGVWIALARGGVVAVVEADGTRRTDIPMPVPMVTSVCFGGTGLTDLYIVTGPEGAPQEVGGGVYRLAGAGPGHPVPLARVRREG
ncbi:MAG: hypothetical protein GEV11_19620 [Streptosporangiales bacterium]|nr:hypothetical protein [Streptosporangiales bacterium]